MAFENQLNSESAELKLVRERLNQIRDEYVIRDGNGNEVRDLTKESDREFVSEFISKIANGNLTLENFDTVSDQAKHRLIAHLVYLDGLKQLPANASGNLPAHPASDADKEAFSKRKDRNLYPHYEGVYYYQSNPTPYDQYMDYITNNPKQKDKDQARKQEKALTEIRLKIRTVLSKWDQLKTEALDSKFPMYGPEQQPGQTNSTQNPNNPDAQALQTAEGQNETLEQSKESFNNALEQYYVALYYQGGVVFNGSILGKMLGRSIKNEETGKKMTFGGEKGKRNIEYLRTKLEEAKGEYLKLVHDQKLESLADNATQVDKVNAAQKAQRDVLRHELNQIDQINTGEAFDGMTGASRKFRSWWRKSATTRMGLGFGMMGAGIAGATLAPPLAGAWAGMRAAGGFIGTQALLEKRGFGLSQRGLVDEIAGDLPKPSGDGHQAQLDSVKASAESLVNSLSPDQVKSEVSRLRMLGVVRGSKIDQAAVSGIFSKAKIKREAVITALIEKDIELVVAEVRQEIEGIADDDQRKLALISAVQSKLRPSYEKTEELGRKERVKRIFRNVIAGTAGLVAGILAGDKFLDRDTDIPVEQTSAASVVAVEDLSARDPVVNVNVVPWRGPLVYGDINKARTFIESAGDLKKQILNPENLEKLPQAAQENLKGWKGFSNEELAQKLGGFRPDQAHESVGIYPGDDVFIDKAGRVIVTREITGDSFLLYDATTDTYYPDALTGQPFLNVETGDWIGSLEGGDIFEYAKAGESSDLDVEIEKTLRGILENDQITTSEQLWENKHVINYFENIDDLEDFENFTRYAIDILTDLPDTEGWSLSEVMNYAQTSKTYEEILKFQIEALGKILETDTIKNSDFLELVEWQYLHPVENSVGDVMSKVFGFNADEIEMISNPELIERYREVRDQFNSLIDQEIDSELKARFNFRAYKHGLVDWFNNTSYEPGEGFWAAVRNPIEAFHEWNWSTPEHRAYYESQIAAGVDPKDIDYSKMTRNINSDIPSGEIITTDDLPGQIKPQVPELPETQHLGSSESFNFYSYGLNSQKSDLETLLQLPQYADLQDQITYVDDIPFIGEDRIVITQRPRLSEKIVRFNVVDGQFSASALGDNGSWNVPVSRSILLQDLAESAKKGSVLPQGSFMNYLGEDKPFSYLNNEYEITFDPQTNQIYESGNPGTRFVMVEQTSGDPVVIKYPINDQDGLKKPVLYRSGEDDGQVISYLDAYKVILGEKFTAGLTGESILESAQSPIETASDNLVLDSAHDPSLLSVDESGKLVTKVEESSDVQVAPDSSAVNNEPILDFTRVKSLVRDLEKTPSSAENLEPLHKPLKVDIKKWQGFGGIAGVTKADTFNEGINNLQDQIKSLPAKQQELYAEFVNVSDKMELGIKAGGYNPEDLNESLVLHEGAQFRAIDGRVELVHDNGNVDVLFDGQNGGFTPESLDDNQFMDTKSPIEYYRDKASDWSERYVTDHINDKDSVNRLSILEVQFENLSQSGDPVINSDQLKVMQDMGLVSGAADFDDYSSSYRQTLLVIAHEGLLEAMNKVGVSELEVVDIDSQSIDDTVSSFEQFAGSEMSDTYVDDGGNLIGDNQEVLNNDNVNYSTADSLYDRWQDEGLLRGEFGERVEMRKQLLDKFVLDKANALSKMSTVEAQQHALQELGKYVQDHEIMLADNGSYNQAVRSLGAINLEDARAKLETMTEELIKLKAMSDSGQNIFRFDDLVQYSQ